MDRVTGKLTFEFLMDCTDLSLPWERSQLPEVLPHSLHLQGYRISQDLNKVNGIEQVGYVGASLLSLATC